MKKVLVGVVLSLITVARLAASQSWQNEGEIVTGSNLIWQDSMEASFTRQTWESADKYCKTLELGGHKGWRLPTLSELLLIVDYDRSSPSIFVTFKHTGQDYYWTASPYTAATDGIWVVRFTDGSTDKSYKTYENYVRCVRDK